MIPQPCGLLFVFSGPSGAGKNTIMKAVVERETNLRQLPTATTRPQRDTEVHGREHEFISQDDFRARILNKALIEWQIIHDKGIYGVPRATIQEGIRMGQTLVADVDVLGAMQLKQEFGDHLVLIFVSAPDMDTLEKRIRTRGQNDPKPIDEDEVQARLRRADFEMQFARHYDHVLVNRDGELEAVIQEAIAIIASECNNSAAHSTSRMGWNPDDIQQLVTGLVVQDGKVLLHQHSFPQISVPDNTDDLPYDVISDLLESELGVDILPTRHDSLFRQVPVSFEPPQLVDSQENGHLVEKNFIYVLQPAERIDTLPSDEWMWLAIEDLELELPLRNVLNEAALMLQP